MIVVDASVVVDFLLGRPPALEAMAERTAGHEFEWLHAPDLVEPEALNALRRLSRRGSITERRAWEAVADLGRLRLRRHPHAALRERTWDLRHRLTAYDACYLALAEGLDQPLLMTADAGLATVARAVLGAGRVDRVG